MSIPPRFLDELRSRLSLSEVIGKRIKVTRAGREYKACCPFHSEKTPSFTINDAKQFYHCFGCGAHGDVIGFTMQYENLSFIDAVKTLAAQTGLQMPEQSPEEIQKAAAQKDLYTLMEEATKFFQAALHEGANRQILEYTRGRGLSDQTISNFRIGYASGDRQALWRHLKEKGYSDAQIKEVDLIRESKKGGDPYAFFRDRVMFPVTDLRGRVVAFGGRILPDNMRPPDTGDFTPPKYINSGETPIFHKGSLLYAASQARSNIDEEQPLIVAEGYMDVIACHQAGFTGAVAPMGTALTEGQITALWKMIPQELKEPVLCFDGDEAGRRAARRAAERILPLLGPNKSARFAFLPEGKDPDDLIKEEGHKAFADILKRAMPLIDFIWSTHVGARPLDTPEKRAGAIEAVKNDIRMVADRAVQSHYNAIVQDKISQSFFPKRDYGGGAARRSGQGRDNGRGGAGAVSLRSPGGQKQAIMARVLLAGLLNHPHIFGAVEEELAQMSFADSGLDELRRNALAYLSENDSNETAVKPQDIADFLKDKGYVKTVGDILSSSVYIHAGFCAPHEGGQDEDEAQSAVTAQKWLEFYRATQGDMVQREIRQGWRSAYDNDDVAEEERLKSLLASEAAQKDG